MKCVLTLFALSLFFTPPTHALDLTGSIFKDNKHETVAFDFAIRGSKSTYLMNGTTATAKGLYRSDLDFSFVKVTKESDTPDGRVFRKNYRNLGTLKVFPRARVTENMVLAGIPVLGQFIQGYCDDGIWFTGLNIGGIESQGSLDYNSWNGHYNAKGDCSFGACRIKSAASSGKCVIDYDNMPLVHQNAMTLDMGIGSLVVKGTINFTDTTQTTIIPGSGKDGDGGTSSTTVTATVGRINAKVMSEKGTEPMIADSNDQDADDEKEIRTLLAFFELMAYDIFAE